MYYIYRITNKINGKTYIGKHEYKKLNDSYMGSGVILKKAQKKYGIENFEKKILVFNISKLEHVNLLEETFIAAEREKVGRENCYNCADGGDGGSTMRGKHLTEEWKRKISKSLKDHYVSEETRKKLSEALKGKPGTWKGKHHSEETKRKIAESNKGKQVSEETRKKLSEAGKNRHPSEETRKKLSEAALNMTEERKRKIAEAKKGHNVSEETRRKIAESKKGKPSCRKGKKYVFYKCVETGEIGTINDWNKRKFYHVNYGKSKGFTFIIDETVPSIEIEKTIKTKKENK